MLLILKNIVLFPYISRSWSPWLPPRSGAIPLHTERSQRTLTGHPLQASVFIQSSPCCLHNSSRQQKNNTYDKSTTNKGKTPLNPEQKDAGNPNQRASSTFFPKTTETPRYEIKPGSLGEKIQYMKDHAIIAKFIGTWPNERDLIRWIR